MTLTHTATVLEKILANTRLEVAARQSAVPLAAIMHSAAAAPAPRNFLAALSLDSVALIAEIKHASPSRGVLIDPFDPLALAQTYAANGAAAISILTDERFFQGHLEHLRAVRQVSPLPILRKDFMIDAYQIYESRAAGADAVLSIVAALEDAQLQSAACPGRKPWDGCSRRGA
ncbi:indole-3-glycerol phosphate synthase [Chloroflexota bacterium]|nr:indole-3-glycerol phosphate synthase [Chloroflexota bacterium]